MTNFRNTRNSGFTMIELLMVIMLVAILGAVALPQFLDFRSEGKVAAATAIKNSIDVGIKLQKMNAKLKCNAAMDTPIPYASFASNDITAGAGALCTTSQITLASERRFVDTDNFPKNPYNGLTTVGACTSSTYVGYCYNESTETVTLSSNTVNDQSCTTCSQVANGTLGSPSLTCTGTGCIQEANGNIGSPTLSCPEGYCTQTCNGNTAGCTLNCAGGHCNMTCNSNGT